MKLYKIKSAIMFTMAIVFITACTKDFEEINTNPNAPLDVPAGLLNSAIAERTADQLQSTFVGGDMGECWVGHWSKVQYNGEERYSPRGTVLDGIWNTLYAGSLQDAKVMYDLGVEEENANIQGVALIWQAYNYLLLTDMYGDVPFTEALSAKEGINNPAYDSQADIYTAALTMLDDANALLTANGGTINATSDIVYGGDYSKWKKFANSLKFRALMRISSAPGMNVGSQLQDIISSRVMFTSAADEAKLVYLEAAPNNNPVHNTVVAGNRGEFKMNSVIVDRLIAENDPRLSIYAQLNDGGIYRGKPAGISDVPNAEYGYENVSSIGEKYLDAQEPAYFMSYAEQEFLIAEAVQRGLVAGNAEIHYNAGIMASMADNGVAAAGAAYLAAHPYAAGTGLTQIAEEKWVALFGQGVEAWTEWRRTRIPAIAPAIEPLNGITDIPTRYTYPPSEQGLNKENYDAAVSAQGADVLNTAIWWLK